MILSARFLESVCSVNSFDYAGNTIEFTQGDVITVYFQLVDKSLDKKLDPPFKRYMPNATSTLSVVVESIDDAKKITRSATQPFATSDPSIWALRFLATDTIRGTCSMRLTLSEGTTTVTVTHGLLLNAFRIQSVTAI